jgi:hypothetical protein
MIAVCGLDGEVAVTALDPPQPTSKPFNRSKSVAVVRHCGADHMVHRPSMPADGISHRPGVWGVCEPFDPHCAASPMPRRVIATARDMAVKTYRIVRLSEDGTSGHARAAMARS